MNMKRRSNTVGCEIDQGDYLNEGGDPIETNEHDDIENIDYNNYKGIYAEDDAGQKYQCPETGAHFEPKDLCRRLYQKIIDKIKPYEMQLYGQPMLLDGVGSSLIAEAPYAAQHISLSGKGNSHKMNSSSQGKNSFIQSSQVQAPNARAGSMKQQQVVGMSNKNAITEAYENSGQIQSNLNLQNQNMLNMSNMNQSQLKVKQSSNNNISNVEQCMSSSLMSEKVDKKHMVNFSAGNQKNIKFKNKFGEPSSQVQTFQQQHQQTAQSKSPQKNRVNTQPNQMSHNRMSNQKQGVNARGSSGLNNISQQNNQNSRNNALPNQSLSMHVINNQKTFNQVNPKSLSIGGNNINGLNSNALNAAIGTQLGQGNSRQQTNSNKGIPSRLNTVQNNNQKNFYQQSNQNSTQQQQAQYSKRGMSGGNSQIASKRAQSHGQNNLQQAVKKTQQAPPQKDAFTLIQEQQRAEQAKQPQNQFEHQENILKQLNSDEVYEKLMKIFNEREALYEQLELEQQARNGQRDSQRLSINQKIQQQKNSSAEPVARGHLNQNSNMLSGGPNIKQSPYQAGVNMGHNQQSQQNIPLKTQPSATQSSTQFQSYMQNQHKQNQHQMQNSRNQVLKSGIGGRLNTKNNNQHLSGISNGRNNTQASYGGPSIGKSPNKSSNIYGQNQTVISASGGQGPSGPQSIAGPSGQARGGSGLNVQNKSIGHTNNIHQTSKAQKKKTLNLSNHQNNTSTGGTTKLLHQSQISLNNINSLGGNSSHHNTFYGNINQQNHPSRQPNPGLQGKPGTHASQNQSKNDIIAKYMKSINNNNQSSGSIGPRTMSGKANNQSSQQQIRNPSNGHSNQGGMISQYNNFMKSVVVPQSNGSNSNQVQKQVINASGHSRNYQNQLGQSSKTHTESMIYNNNQNALNMGNSFNHGQINQNNYNSRGSNKSGGNMFGQNHLGTSSSSNIRPSTSNYSGKMNSMQQKQKKQSSSNMNDIQSQNQAHVINQSLKPKMIMNNNIGMQQSTRAGGGPNGGSLLLNQHTGNSGDVQVQNISIGGRPQSSKIQKKKASNLTGGQFSNQQSYQQQMNVQNQQQRQQKMQFYNAQQR